MTTIDQELNKVLDKWYISFPRETFKEDIKEAIYVWLESKRLMPLSRTGDMIDITDLQFLLNTKEKSQ